MPAERVQPLLKLGTLPARVQVLAGQVQIPVVADLMAARGDRGHRRRMLIGGMPWHVERRGDLMPGQQLQNPGEAAARPEPAKRPHGQPAVEFLTLTEPGRLAVNVESQCDGGVGAGRPASENCLGADGVLRSPRACGLTGSGRRRSAAAA